MSRVGLHTDNPETGLLSDLRGIYNQDNDGLVGSFDPLYRVMPPSIKMLHIDSYNTTDPDMIRFQGIFYIENGILVDAPLEILKIASKYKTEARRTDNEEDYTIWTIWFDRLKTIW